MRRASSPSEYAGRMRVMFGAIIVPTGPASVTLPPPRSGPWQSLSAQPASDIARCLPRAITLDRRGPRERQRRDVVDLVDARVVRRRLDVDVNAAHDDDDGDGASSPSPILFSQRFMSRSYLNARQRRCESRARQAPRIRIDGGHELESSLISKSRLARRVARVARQWHSPFAARRLRRRVRALGFHEETAERSRSSRASRLAQPRHVPRPRAPCEHRRSTSPDGAREPPASRPTHPPPRAIAPLSMKPGRWCRGRDRARRPWARSAPRPLGSLRSARSAPGSQRGSGGGRPRRGRIRSTPAASVRVRAACGKACDRDRYPS